MSLQDTLEQLRQKIAGWMNRQHRLRQRRLRVVRLEDRRLPDASFAIIGDALTLQGFDGASEAVDVSFDAAADQFHFELSSGNWSAQDSTPLDPAVGIHGNVLTISLSGLSSLQIQGTPDLKQVTDSGDAFTVHQLTITGNAAVTLDQANDFDHVNIESLSLTLHDSDDLQLEQLDISGDLNLSVADSVTSSADAFLHVHGHTEIHSGSVALESAHFTTLSFESSGDVSIEQNGDLELSGSIAARSLDLDVDGTLSNATGTSLDVEQHTVLEADSISLGHHDSDQIHLNSMTFHSSGDVFLSNGDDLQFAGSSNAESLTIISTGELSDELAASIDVTGHMDLTADSITLSSGAFRAADVDFHVDGTVRLLSDSGMELGQSDENGAIVFHEGTLNGSGTIQHDLLMSGDGTKLAGTLEIDGNLTIGAGSVLSPGNSPGIITSGNLTLASNSTLIVEIDDDNAGGNPGGVAGVDYDQISVTGTVTIGTNVTLNLQDLGSTAAQFRDTYTIIANNGTADAVSGTFAGLGNGAIVTATGGLQYRIFYNGGDGNDVVLIGRPTTLSNVFVSTAFSGMAAGTFIADVDFLSAGSQSGVYGIDAHATVAEGISAVDANGVIHVDQGTYLHTGTLLINKSVTIDGQGMGLTRLQKVGAPTGNFDEAIRITANDVTISDVQLGWQIHNTTDYQGYVIVTTADNTTISRVLFGSNATGEGYRSAVVFEGTAGNGADGLEISDSVFEGRWGRAAIRDGDAGSGTGFLITRNEFREDHFRWGPIAIGPQDSAGNPNNFAFSGEISFNYFGNGLDTVDFQSLGNQNYTLTISNAGLTSAGLKILHNTFDWNDSTETNVNGVYAQPAGVYITPSLTANTDQILIQDNIFNNFAYAGAQPGTTDPLWRPTSGVFNGALEFDGADDFGVWQSPLFDVGTAGTLNFWVQMHDTTRRNQFFEGPGNAGFEMQYRSTSGGQVYGRTTTVGGDNVIRSGNDAATLLSGAPNWHNIQYTWDFNATNAVGKMRIYVDGTESGYLTNLTPNDLTWASVVSTVNGLMNIGRDPGDPSRYFDGLMDDVGWFSSALNTADRNVIRTNGVDTLATDARLVAHWNFDQTSGDVAIDNKNGIPMFLSTNGVVPTEFGAVFRPGQGQFGGALEFDGVDDFATFRDPSFDVGTKGSLNFWVQMQDTTRRNQFFEGPDNGGMEMQFRNNTGGQVYGRTSTNNDFVIRAGGDAATLTTPANSWHNIQYTWDFNATNAVGNMRIYVDGIESGYLSAFTPADLSWTAVADTVNGLMNVGRDPGDATRFFDGLMDDIAWYNDVLTSAERATIRSGGVSSHADLVAHWNLDNAVGTTEAAGNSGTNITLYINQIAPAPPVSGYGVVTPAAALVLNNVFYNDVPGTYADSNQTLDPSNLTGTFANPFFAGDDPNTPFTGTTLAEFYRLRWGSSATYQATEFQVSIATAIPHIGANQQDAIAFGTEDVLVAGTDFDDLLVVTFTSQNDGFFTFTRNVTGVTPDFAGTFQFTDVTSFTFNGYGGDDVFIVVQPTTAQGSLFSLIRGITFSGGLENNNGNALNSLPDSVTGGDTFLLLKPAADQATLDTAAYEFLDQTATGNTGTISLNEGLASTVIRYNGTEAVRDELQADDRQLVFAAAALLGSETIVVSAPGETVVMNSTFFGPNEIKPAVSSRTLNNQIQSTLGANVSFNNPLNQLTIDAGAGNDTVNINGLDSGYRASLTIVGGTGTDTVNLNASLTLGDATAANTGKLTVTADTILVASNVAINTTAETTGDGDVELTAALSLSNAAGSSIRTSTGHVIETAADGLLDVAGPITTGSGNILLQSTGAGRNLQVDADVQSSSGHISLAAANSILLGAGADVQTATTGTISLQAVAGVMTMDVTSSVATSNGDIRAIASGNITVGNIVATAANVSLISSLSSILDADGDDAQADVTALGLRMQAAASIGTLGAGNNAIETTVTTLSARAGFGGINVLESNGLTVGDVSVSVQRTQSTGAVTTITDSAQSDLVTSNAGSIVLRSTNGSLILNDGTASANGSAVSANGIGNILIQTIAGAADVVLNADVATGSGHVSLFSSDDVDLNANVSTGGTGTVSVVAGNISTDAVTGIDMLSGTSITTAGGNIRLSADRESDVRLALLNAGSGNVSLLAERSVLDNNGAALNVQANAVRIVADAGISNSSNQAGIIGGSATGNLTPDSNANAIDLQVTTLAAQSATGIYLREVDGLTVDATPQISVQNVNGDASVTVQSDLSLSDLVTTNNGPIKLQTTAGSIVLNDGDADSLVLSTNGSGAVLLQTLAADGDILINSALRSITGNVTINSSDDIHLNGVVSTGGTGTVYLLANNGTADAAGSQADGITLNSGISSNSGDILINSLQDVHQSALISSVDGDIGIIAGRDILQDAAGDTTTASGNVLISSGRDWMMNPDAVISVGGGQALGRADGQIALGRISLTNSISNTVAIEAGSSLSDSNGATVNIEETSSGASTSVSLRAGGAIGNSDSLNLTPAQNANAIDLNVDAISAVAGAAIYLQEFAVGGGLTVSNVAAVTVSIDNIQQARFNSTNTDAGQSRTISSREDLTTNNGPIKVVAENGTIVVNGGNDAVGVSAGGIGDVLLEARGAGSDVIVNAAVSSGSGHVTLNAEGDVDVNASITTGGSGTVYVAGAGISLDGSVTTANGDVLIYSLQEINQTAAINSTSGDVGLIAGTTITQSSSGDITTNSGDVLIEAGTDWTMSTGTVITAGGGDFAGKALNGSLALGRINAARTAMSASRDISDANGTTLNVDGTSLSLRAGGMIGNHDNTNGTPSTNTNAIDTQVTTLAAVAGTGIYIEESNSLIIDTVAAVNVAVDGPKRANFNSTTTNVLQSRTTNALEDLTTTNNGSIKIVTLNGTIIVNDGTTASAGISANGTGDILLEARGASSDVTINGNIVSTTGHISVKAADDVLLTANLATAGPGTVYVKATNQNMADSSGIRMSSSATIITAGGNVRLLSDNESDILLGSINAATGSVSLLAERSILDSNGALQNVQAHALRIVADAAVSNSANQAGIIGGSDTGAAAMNNINAIDTNVNILAAQSADGIYIKESDGLTVDATAAIFVDEARFNGSTTRHVDASLSDLTTSHNGVIKLQTVTGSVVLNEGGNGNRIVIDANGTGDVLIETLASNGDVIVSGRIRSGAGHITLNAGDDVIVNRSVTTSGAGTIFLSASSGTADSVGSVADGVTLTAALNNFSGDVLVKSDVDVILAAAITSSSGNIGVMAGRDLTQTNEGDIASITGNVLLLADRHWTNDSDTVIHAGGGELIGRARTGDVVFGRIDATHAAITAGRNVLDANGGLLNVAGQTLSLRAGGSIGTSVDRLETRIATLAAQSATGIFLNETDSLTIDTVGAITVNINSPVRVNLNSTTTSVAEVRTTQSLEDLTTTGYGPIQILTRAGSLTINGGADSVGITSAGTGAIQLTAVGASSDIVVSASLSSGTGNIQLTADDDLDVNASLQTDGGGQLNLRALNSTASDFAALAGSEVDGINIDASLITGGGDVLLTSALDIRQSAAITSDSGDVIFTADRDVFQTSSGEITTSLADVLINAGRNWTMSSNTVITSSLGNVGGITAAGEIFMGRINASEVVLQSFSGIQDNNSTQLNVVSQRLSLKAGRSTGDDGSNTGTFSASADAIDTQVNQLAVESPKGIAINERDDLIINRTTSQTIGGTTFDAVTGMQTVNSDIFLNVGGDLTLNSQLKAGTADVRITASGNVTQNADGIVVADELGIRQISTGQADIRLFSANDVNVLSASNAFDGGDIQFHDTDDLIVRTVSAQTVGLFQFDGVSGIVATGGDIEIRAVQDLTILKTIVSSNGVEDSTAASGEKITLESVDGNILIDATNGPILITSDEAPGSNAVTGDQIVLLADSDGNYNGDLDGDKIPDSVDKDIDGDGILNSVDSVLNGRIQGQVKFVGDVTLSTDGGVAKKFAKRPEVGLPATAFFVYVSKPMPLAIDNSPVSWVGTNAYLDGFFIEVGVQGEENLVLDLDWQDPADEPGVVNDALIQQGAQASGIIHAVSSERLQQFLVANGGNVNTVGHVYTALDFTLFQQVQNITTIVVDFSVSHHSSIDVRGVSVSQAHATETVPGRDLASTDNRNTFPGLFENGIATFKIPTVTPAPAALFNGAAVARVDRPFAVSVPEQRTVTSQAMTTDFGGGAVSGSAFSTEVYFQIRRQFEADGPAEVVVERITDSSLISSREAFEKFVQQTPALQDGAGYEIWLISETGGQKVERPIVEFEITGGLPGTADDENTDPSDGLRLKDLPFEQPEGDEGENNIPGDDMSSLEKAGKIDAALDGHPSETASPTSAVDRPSLQVLEKLSAAEADEELSPAMDSQDDQQDLSETLSPAVSSGLTGLAVGRFRKRQRQTVQEVTEHRYSRASRFSRRNS